MLGRNLLWVREPGSGALKGWVGAWPPAPTRAALRLLHPFSSDSAEGGADLFPGCPASRAPGGSTLASLCCQGSAGSVGDSGLGFRRLWGFGWVSCGLGFLGSSLMAPRAAEPGLLLL